MVEGTGGAVASTVMTEGAYAPVAGDASDAAVTLLAAGEAVQGDEAAMMVVCLQA